MANKTLEEGKFSTTRGTITFRIVETTEERIVPEDPEEDEKLEDPEPTTTETRVQWTLRVDIETPIPVTLQLPLVSNQAEYLGNIFTRLAQRIDRLQHEGDITYVNSGRNIACVNATIANGQPLKPHEDDDENTLQELRTQLFGPTMLTQGQTYQRTLYQMRDHIANIHTARLRDHARDSLTQYLTTYPEKFLAITPGKTTAQRLLILDTLQLHPTQKLLQRPPTPTTYTTHNRFDIINTDDEPTP